MVAFLDVLVLLLAEAVAVILQGGALMALAFSESNPATCILMYGFHKGLSVLIQWATAVAGLWQFIYNYKAPFYLLLFF